MTVKLTIMYDGSLFYGYEWQTDKRTVQGELESALLKLYCAQVKTTASGRTDAGVHALGQVVSYSTLKELKTERIKAALNTFLPPDIRVKTAEYVQDGFNPRMCAKQKTYYYDFYAAENDNPLLISRALRLDEPPDLELMKKGAELFVGTHDFSNFYCIGSSAKTTTRTVYSCHFLPSYEVYGETVYRLAITAGGFLYKMVRLIMGALINLNKGKLTIEELKSRIDCTAQNPRKITAPACGLYLVQVEYNS